MLCHVNLDVKPGSFVAIVGQSGSGKSTLMKLLSRLYAPREERIVIMAMTLPRLNFIRCVDKSASCPRILLFSGSVNDNIALTAPNHAVKMW